MPEFLSVNWTAPTWDLFIVLFFLVTAFLYGFSLGRDRIIVILISLYMALAVVNSAPFIRDLSTELNVATSLFAFKISTFLVVFLALFFFLSRSALLRALGAGSAPGSWWQVLLFSTLHAGLLISVVLSFLSADQLAVLAESTRQLFVSDAGRFVWITLPILAMVGLPDGDPKPR